MLLIIRREEHPEKRQVCFTMLSKIVSILIVLDVVLEAALPVVNRIIARSFNPYCTGSNSGSRILSFQFDVHGFMPIFCIAIFCFQNVKERIKHEVFNVFRECNFLSINEI